MKIHPLKQWLKKNNVSTKEFAGNIGVSISYVNYITSFKRTPSLRLLKKILEATNNELTINDFININNKEDL
jgi:transcriptional regulator with XRE-family HTH domain